MPRRSSRSKKLSLVITQEPPSVFYNQKFGTSHAMAIGLELNGSLPSEVIHSHQLLPLHVELLYESMKPVANQGIMQFMEPPEFDTDQGTAEVLVRINELSSAHRRQLFRFRVSLGIPFSSISVLPAITTPVKVLSKTNPPSSNKRRRIEVQEQKAKDKENDGTSSVSGAASEPSSASNSHGSQGHPVLEFCRFLLSTLQQPACQWQYVGYEAKDDASPGGTRSIIRKCPLCDAVDAASRPGAHVPTCGFLRLATSYASIMQLDMSPLALKRLSSRSSVEEAAGSLGLSPLALSSGGSADGLSFNPPLSLSPAMDLGSVPFPASGLSPALPSSFSPYAHASNLHSDKPLGASSGQLHYWMSYAGSTGVVQRSGDEEEPASTSTSTTMRTTGGASNH